MRRGFSRTGRGRSAAPGFNVHGKIAPSPPSTRRRRGGRATALRAVRPVGAAGAGKVLMAPRRNRRSLWGYAPACCGRLCQSVPSPTLASACTSRRTVHRHAPSLVLWSFHATPQARRRKLRQRAFSLVVGVLASPASGRKPVKPSCGDAELVMSPFGTGGPCVLGLS